MTDAEFRASRIGFLQGIIEGIRLYAIWQNGEQVVGCLQRPIKEVLQPYVDELAGLTYDKSSSNANREQNEPTTDQQGNGGAGIQGDQG